jgi:hypothetical protein
MTARPCVLIGFAALASGGCYQYRPVPDLSVTPEPGAEVRVRLSTPRPLEMGSVTLSDITLVEGEVFRARPDTLSLFSRWLRTAYGSRHHSQGAVFVFPREQIVTLEQRKLDPLTTGLAVVLLVGAGIGLVVVAAELAGGGSVPPDDPGPTFGLRAPFP